MSIAHPKTERLKSFLLKNSAQKTIIVGAFAVNIIVYWFYFVLIYSSNAVILYNNTKILINDYYMTFSPAVYKFLTDPTTIFTTQQIPVPIPFRSLPALLFYYMIFYGLPHATMTDFYVCLSCIILWNLGSCILITKIMKLKKFKENQGTSIFTISAVIIAFYMLNLWQAEEYFHANTNVITGFFVLLGVYFFLSDRESYGYVAWSIAITFKIMIIFLVIFFIFQPPFKRFLKNLVYVLIPQIPNIIIFAIYPSLISNYVTSNLSDDVNLAAYFYHSGDIAREISWNFNLPFLPLVISFFLVFFTINFYLCYKAGHITFINKLMLTFLTIIVIFPDFTYAHVLFLLGVYLLWLASRDDPIFSKSPRILIGLPLISFTFFFVTAFIPFPSISLFYLISLLIIDYRLIVSLKGKIPATILNQQ